MSLAIAFDAVFVVADRRQSGDGAAAARRLGGGRGGRRRHLAVARVLGQHPIAAIRQTARLILRLQASVVGFVAVTVAAAERRQSRSRRRVLAVFRLASLDELALGRAVAHIGVLVGAHVGVPRSQPFAAAHALRRRGRSVGAVSVLAVAPLTLAAALALRLRISAAAHFVLFDALAIAAAHLLRRGRRLGGGHLAVGLIVRHAPVAPVRDAPLLIARLVAFAVRFVAVAIAAARRRRRRRRARRSRRGHHAVVRVIRHSEVAAHLQASALIRRAQASVVRFVAIAVAAAHLQASALIR